MHCIRVFFHTCIFSVSSKGFESVTSFKFKVAATFINRNDFRRGVDLGLLTKITKHEIREKMQIIHMVFL